MIDNFANTYFSAIIASSVFAIVIYFLYIKNIKRVKK